MQYINLYRWIKEVRMTMDILYFYICLVLAPKKSELKYVSEVRGYVYISKQQEWIHGTKSW